LSAFQLITDLNKPTANLKEPRFNGLQMKANRHEFGLDLDSKDYEFQGNAYFPVTQDSFTKGLTPFNQMQFLNIRSVPELQFEERKLQIEDALAQYELNTKELESKGLLTSTDANARIENYREITRIKRMQNQSQFEIDKANENKTQVDLEYQKRDLMNSVDYAYSLNEFKQKMDEIVKITAIKQEEIKTSILLSEEEKKALIEKSEDLKLKQTKKLEEDRTKAFIDASTAITDSIKSSQISRYRSGGGNEFVANRMQRDLEIQQAAKERDKKIEEAKIEVSAGKMTQEQFNEREGQYTAEYEERVKSIRDANKDILSTMKQLVTDNLINDLSSGFTDVIMGVRTLNDVLGNLANSILSGLINMAIKMLLQSLVGEGGLLGGLFSAIGGLFGGGGKKASTAFTGGEVTSTGVVPNYAGGGIIQSINQAVLKEKSANGGIKPVLAVLTPGERVLTVEQNKRFEDAGLHRVIDYNVLLEERRFNRTSNYMKGNGNSEIGNYADGGIIEKIKTYSDGGVVSSNALIEERQFNRTNNYMKGNGSSEIRNYADGGIVEKIRTYSSGGVVSPEEKQFHADGGIVEKIRTYSSGGVVSPEEKQFHRTMNYSSGGVVNAGVAPTINTENTSNSNVVNIPINIESNGNNASSNGLDASQLRSAVQSAVLNEIQRQQRQGGTIPKR
jgi:hypothetical protein